MSPPTARSVRAGRSPRALADLDDVVVLGPTEEPFAELVDLALESGAPELLRGVALVDTGSLTDYTLLALRGRGRSATTASAGSTASTPRPHPLLGCRRVRGRVGVADEAPIGRPAPAPADKPAPACRAEADDEAAPRRTREIDRAAAAAARLGPRRPRASSTSSNTGSSTSARPAGRRARQPQGPVRPRSRPHRLAQLDARSRDVAAAAAAAAGRMGPGPGAARADQTSGMTRTARRSLSGPSWTELERLGFEVDDRQTAGVGLRPPRPQPDQPRTAARRGQRLPAQSRARVARAERMGAGAPARRGLLALRRRRLRHPRPTVVVRAQDPAEPVLRRGPRRIERFQISIHDLRQATGEDSDDWETL